ncbi:MAG: hypothetical protein VYB88_03415 [Pseudomonadota bacterium]|uniref:hypothetical protein n=1 Tax=Ralstonia pickettii TaxID=329 RepID=UPI002714CF8E|nr:hypothetical protein [Ralstonia pickettii]MEE2976498.1 hypothetical protein [Pseudomonadota bacterium]WKZ86386.1 hypothetical protein N5B55_05370 [Ralstonia pickettii]
MQALKDIGSIAALFGSSPLAKSPLWGKPVDQIHPASILAFQTRLAFDGQAAEATRIIETLIEELSAAVQRGEIEDVPVAAYRPPMKRSTLGEFRQRLELMDAPRPAAVLFGLETGLDIEAVITLTREQAAAMRGRLSEKAKKILDLQPRALFSRYVFWQTINGRQQPLFGLSLEIADLFDREWSELCAAFKSAIPVDLELERQAMFA